MPSTTKTIVTRLLVTLMALAGITLAVRFIIDDRFNRDIHCLDEGPSVLYRAETLAKISMQCVSDARLGQATTYAYAALRRQPHNQLALAALGSVADLKNDPVRADFWFGRAKELGHRDYSVETYWIARSAAQQQWSKVVQHIDALFRAGWKSDDAEAQLRLLESTAEGRKAIMAILHPSSPWIATYLMNTALLTDAELAGRRQMLLDIDKGRQVGAEFFNLTVAAPTIKALYDHGHHEAAYSLRQRLKPFTNGSVVNDPNFENFSKEVATPFDWISRSSAGIDLARIQSISGSTFLRLNVDDPGRYFVLEQTLRLDPGSYTVCIQGITPSQTDSNFVLEIRSLSSSEKLKSIRLPLPQAKRESTASFTILSNAQFFRVSLLLDAGSTTGGSSLDLRSVALDKMQ